MAKHRCWPWAHVWHQRDFWNMPYKKCGMCGRIRFEKE